MEQRRTLTLSDVFADELLEALAKIETDYGSHPPIPLGNFAVVLMASRVPHSGVRLMWPERISKRASLATECLAVAVPN